MYHVSTQGVDERMINVHYYYKGKLNSEFWEPNCTVNITIIMYIYHALINALSAHMIYINLNMILYTHVEHSPTKTIHIRYYKK